jgi:hypothetical protein
MSSMVVGGCKSVDDVYSRRGYREPVVIAPPIIDHKYGHYVKPNKVALKYLDFKKDVDPIVHVRMFNYVIKVNAKTFEKYIINAFSYMLRITTLEWCHNYMAKFPNYIFSKFTHAFCKHHQKIQNDK